MKKFTILGLVLTFILGMAACSDTQNDSSINSEKYDLIPMVMVDGVLYLDTGYTNTDIRKCGTPDGEIISEVDGSEMPTENNQSNFGMGYGYQYGTTEGTIDVYLNNTWRIFATEEVRKKIQFPETKRATWSIAFVLENTDALLQLSEEDAAELERLLSSDNWFDEGSQCDSDILLESSDGTRLSYHSECGTFNDLNKSRSLSLNDGEKGVVNELLRKYGRLEADYICDIESFEYFSDMRDSFTAVTLELDGTEIYRLTDTDNISLIADVIENARKLEYEPKTYNISGDFLLVFETESGSSCCVQLDLVEDLYNTADGFYDYGEPDTQAVKKLWTLLGIEQWPDAVYEKYGWFFDGNGIDYKK